MNDYFQLYAMKIVSMLGGYQDVNCHEYLGAIAWSAVFPGNTIEHNVTVSVTAQSIALRASEGSQSLFLVIPSMYFKEYAESIADPAKSPGVVYAASKEDPKPLSTWLAWIKIHIPSHQKNLTEDDLQLVYQDILQIFDRKQVKLTKSQFARVQQADGPVIFFQADMNSPLMDDPQGSIELKIHLGDQFKPLSISCTGLDSVISPTSGQSHPSTIERLADQWTLFKVNSAINKELINTGFCVVQDHEGSQASFISFTVMRQFQDSDEEFPYFWIRAWRISKNTSDIQHPYFYVKYAYCEQETPVVVAAGWWDIQEVVREVVSKEFQY